MPTEVRVAGQPQGQRDSLLEEIYVVDGHEWPPGQMQILTDRINLQQPKNEAIAEPFAEYLSMDTRGIEIAF